MLRSGLAGAAQPAASKVLRGSWNAAAAKGGVLVPVVLNLGLRRAARRLWAIAETAILPTLPLRLDASTLVPRCAMTLIYRGRNSGIVEKLVEQANAAKIRVLLWALDDVTDSLAPYTFGQGRGSRSVLQTRLVQACGLGDDEYLVMSDDDVGFVVGGFSQFLKITVEAGFMVSQPAHIRDSHYNFAFTCGQACLTARSTHFVEIGPMVAIHPAFRDRVFPMRAELGMGWGAEVEWHSALRPGEHFGIIDAVRMRHCNPAGVDYDTAIERARLEQILTAAGFHQSEDMCKIIEPWFRWRRWKGSHGPDQRGRN